MVSIRPASLDRGNPLTLTAEAGGYVLTCVCRWLRFYTTRPDSDAGRREHEKKCKAARGEGDE